MSTAKAETTDSSPPADWRNSSLDNDDQDLDRFGYKAQLKRRFGLWSMLGLSCVIMVTWEGWLTLFQVNLANGGRAGCVYGFLFSWIGYAAVCASLSELVSMIPTAGGQYHWTYELAPPEWRNFVSWITGWQIVVAWQTDLAAICYLCANSLEAIVMLNYPDVGFQRWHVTFLFWIFIFFGIFCNTVLTRVLPFLEGTVLVIHLLSFVVVLTSLLYFGPRVSAHEVFAEFLTLGNYSQGLTFFVGLISAVFGFLGADGVIHMSEEVRGARTVVPNALMLSILINGLLGFAFVIGVTYTIDDIQSILTPSTGVAFVDYFHGCLGSKAWATCFSSLFLVLFSFTVVAVMATTSRITWAFARDNGLPGSSWIKKVSWHIPFTSIILTASISMLLSFINIGSVVAFNAMVSVTIAAFFGSYAIPIAMVFWMRITGQKLDFGPWHLGRLGVWVNGLSLMWLIICWTFSFFPASIPVTWETMNFSCLLWTGVMIFGLLWYAVYQRHHFGGPVIRFSSMSIH